MNYSIIVCDDDRALSERLADQIKIAIQNMRDDSPNYDQIQLQISLIANSFDEVIAFLKQKTIENGIYFLDIELSHDPEAKNGVDLAEKIKEHDSNAQIIFVIAYDKYAPLTYRRRIGAIDYINKAQTRNQIINRLEETLKNAIDNLTMAEKVEVKSLIYRVGHRVQKVRADEIYYIENSSVQHKVKMVTETGESEFKGTITHLDQENAFLMKVSQSFLVNPENIAAIDLSNRIISFPNGDEVSFSRDRKNIINQILNQFHGIEVN
ncbi:DNA-binding response regulator [Lactobacillus amylolyticus]|uniref:LytR/AlgR family response regulator transcription factor n=1 Tax=Lactobacillus amylolyticus TaxID=83683 RepID=UPI0009B9D6E2|nr:LytTR family DNA-binding domain-containing protein [Lactobacillus amylolyticus]ARD06465.1 DNA-binding response regulator [Lactobacillus amylolyticus]